MRGTVIERPRSNQPAGYVAREHGWARPRTHYGVLHNYVYYPVPWTDAATGREYRQGYYDEDGAYYEDVAFREDGVYKNVLCKCEYCDTITKLDWTESGPLICPQCGGAMKLLSTLDEYTRDPQYETLRNRSDYVDYADRDGGPGEADDLEPKRILGILLAVLVAVLMLVSLAQSETDSRDEGYDPEHRPEDGWVYLGNGAYGQYGRPDGSIADAPVSNVELFGAVVYLRETAPGVCAITDLPGEASRRLIWSYSEDSYYENDSGLWLWYNTDVYPSLWQYWYEPISGDYGDYGDYGWMEYEDGVWYIEAEEGDWIPVPASYDTSPLWHIDPEAAPAPTQPAASDNQPAQFDDSPADLTEAEAPNDPESPDDSPADLTEAEA